MNSAAVDINHYDQGRMVGCHSGAVGQHISFGDCRTGCCATDVRTPGAAGHIVGFETHWVIANHSRDVPLTVCHAESPTDRLAIRPGQGDTIVPFDIAAISGANGHVLTVLGAGPGTNDCQAPCAGDLTVAWGLDPAAIYFKVMITAVRPIIERTNDPLPTSSEIAEELDLTPRQLYDHLTHVCRLLHLTPPSENARGPWRLAALAAYVREHPFIQPSDAPSVQ